MNMMQTKADIEGFVTDWVARNVRVIPRNGSVTLEVDRLAAELTGDARAHGISGGDINRALGNIDEYLTGQLQAVSEPPSASEPPPA